MLQRNVRENRGGLGFGSEMGHQNHKQQKKNWMNPTSSKLKTLYLKGHHLKREGAPGGLSQKSMRLLILVL